jgi:hypothetical protein
VDLDDEVEHAVENVVHLAATKIRLGAHFDM